MAQREKKYCSYFESVERKKTGYFSSLGQRKRGRVEKRTWLLRSTKNMVHIHSKINLIYYILKLFITGEGEILSKKSSNMLYIRV